ncbi:alpha-(1,3)-fucosyltransferase C-like [Danaus plexippus]|uniref:alpha-(1,3)-fucosyltransferase C-like n=1 Tax=Danaus plexippus TaxID=13037 RepID=UPI002AB319FE|nr:alpha-(1,3)-fucosyltransferase C-like [Danaus plexippus]
MSEKTSSADSEKTESIKHILIWTEKNLKPLINLGEGRTVFIEKKCEWNNCNVTGDRNLLGDYTEFEAIIFGGTQLYLLRYKNDLPKRRDPKQKYIYANLESAASYPVCTSVWNYFFNTTWTYRLDSTLFWPYFIIEDSNNIRVGPKKNIHWMNISDMDPIDKDLKVKFKFILEATIGLKSKAAAWFVSNCNTMSLRELFVKQLEEQMHVYALELDVYGDCGKLQCSQINMKGCELMLQKNYYFYLAFENTFSEDYVTEKILHALRHDTVPIVFGGANYTRFMPEGSYLNALELGPHKLAQRMHELIHNPEAYFLYFKWKKYYSYHFPHEKSETDAYCNFCEFLNTHESMKKKTVIEYFNIWWTPHVYCQDVHNISIH